MSEHGWKQFLAADDLDDWVVLHGGAAAAFRVGSLSEGAQLAVAIAGIDGLSASGAVVTLSGALITVRLTRGVFRLEALHRDLARAVSAAARAQGATPDRSAVQEVQLAISAKPDDLDVHFWRAVLGYAELAEDNGFDPLGHGSTFWVQALDPDKPLRHAMHVDVSVPREHVHRRVAAAVGAGGRIVQESNAPGSWILADRAGNKVCIVAWPDGAETPEWAAATDDHEPADSTA